MKIEAHHPISFLELLTVVFIAFKVLHLVEWSWLIVLSPLLLQTIAGLLLMFLLSHRDD